MALNSTEKIVNFTNKEMEIKDFQMLCQVYYECVSIRASTPVSYLKLISKLGLFKENFIISNEELEAIKLF